MLNREESLVVYIGDELSVYPVSSHLYPRRDDIARIPSSLFHNIHMLGRGSPSSPARWQRKLDNGHPSSNYDQLPLLQSLAGLAKLTGALFTASVLVDTVELRVGVVADAP